MEESKNQTTKKLNPINLRIREIREWLRLDQEAFAKSIDMKQGSISGIENGKSGVSAKFIRKLSEVHGINPEYITNGTLPIINENFSLAEPTEKYTTNAKPYLIPNEGPGNLHWIPLKAQGGFLNGYASKVYMDSLEKTNMPMIRGNCFAFEVEGHSMVSDDDKEESYLPGSWVVGTPLENITWLQKDKVYVFVTIDGIIIKQFTKIVDDKIHLRSLNSSTEYKVPVLPLKSVKKIFFIELVMSKPRR